MSEQLRVKTRARQGSARVTAQAPAWMPLQGAARTTPLGAAGAADRGAALVTASAPIHGKA
jgi:hypothetical protein